MKTRQEMCALILCLITALLLVCLPPAGAQTTNASPSGAGTTSQTVDQSGITGEWRGTLRRNHLTVKVEQAAGGGLAGKLIVTDQGNASVPLDSVSFAPDKTFRFSIGNGAGSYDGKLNESGTEINGTWHESGNSVAFVLRRPGASATAFTLKPRTQGRVALQPCRTADGNLEGLCGKYEVYENRQSQSGRKIALNIMVLPALSDKPAADPFFPLAGGPGQGAVDAFPGIGYVTLVRQHRDIVLVDQRGTGQSNPLPCELRDPKDAQAVIGEYVPIEKVRTCLSELEKKADLAQYTTSIAADDLDEVRQALGYGKINIFGGSYGSRAALEYLRRHGDQTRTITIEGIVPPDYRLMVAFSKTIQHSVDGLMERCAADDACHKDFPDLKKEFQEILDRLDKSPAHFEVRTPNGPQPVTLSRGSFVADLRAILYIPALISQFPYMIHRAYQGDWNAYGALAFALRSAIDKDLNRGMLISVICAEDVPGLKEAEIKRATAGTYLGDFQARMYQQACQEWPRGTIPRNFHDPIHSAVPALLIDGALDPATPPDVLGQMPHDLSKSRTVVVKEGTHGTGSPCIDRLIADFVEQGSSAGLDTSCADQIHFPPFVTQAQVDRARQAATSH